jgi:hypothetical protein
VGDGLATEAEPAFPLPVGTRPTPRPEAPGSPLDAVAVTETVIRPGPFDDAAALPVELVPTFSVPCEPSSAVVFEFGFEPTPSIAAAAAATAPIAPSAIAETTACRIGRALCRGLGTAAADDDIDEVVPAPPAPAPTTAAPGLVAGPVGLAFPGPVVVDRAAMDEFV